MTSSRVPFAIEIDAGPAVRDAGVRRSPAPRSDDDPQLEEIVWQLRALLWRFPLATQAAYAALVREGRAYEKTAEGAELMQRLLHAPVAHRARVLWEVLTCSDVSEAPMGALPSLFLDRVAKVLVSERLEPVLARLFARSR